MKKVILLILILAIFPAPAFAINTPACTNATRGAFLKGTFLENEVDSHCGQNACYIYNNIDDNYECYKALAAPVFANPGTTTSSVANCPTLQKNTNGYFTHTPLTFKLTFDWKNVDPNWEFYLKINDGGIPAAIRETRPKIKITQDTLTQDVTIGEVDRAATYKIELKHDNDQTVPNCDLGTVKVFSQEFSQIDTSACSISVPANVEINKPFEVGVTTKPINKIEYQLYLITKAQADKLKFNAKDILGQGDSLPNPFLLHYQLRENSFTIDYKNDDSQASVSYTQSKLFNNKRLGLGDYAFVIRALLPGTSDHFYCDKRPFKVSKEATSTQTSTSVGNAAPGAAGVCSKKCDPAFPGFTDDPNICEDTDVKVQCCKLTNNVIERTDKKDVCSVTDLSGTAECKDVDPKNPKCSKAGGQVCDPKNPGGPPPAKINEGAGGGIYTAIGCIPTDPLALVSGVMRFAVGAGGGIALLLMIFGAFQMITSAGNPEAIKKGQEQFTSAIIGLLFIIFSTLLLKIIGVDILGLPGLG